MGRDRLRQLLKPIAVISTLLLTGTPVSAAYSALGIDLEAMCMEKPELCEFMRHVSEINGICKVFQQGYMTRTSFNQVLEPLFDQLTSLDNYPGRQAIRELDSPSSTCYELQEWRDLFQ